MASQNVIVYLSPDGGEVEDILNLLAGKEMELEWVGTLNGSDVPIRVRIADDSEDEDDGPGPASSLYGIDPDFTDGLSAVEYLRRNREGVDAYRCIEAGGHQSTTRHTPDECPAEGDPSERAARKARGDIGWEGV